MPNRKIPISLSKDDYNFLNYIQQGSLYTGIPISNVLTISEILKATVLHACLNVYSSWENYGKKLVSEFFRESKKTGISLPDTQKELLLEIEKHRSLELLELAIKGPKFSSIGSSNKELWKKEQETLEQEKTYGSEPLKEPGSSNFILALDDGTIEIFDLLKMVLDVYSGANTSYSEMTRVILRNLFINVDKEDAQKNLERFSILSMVYVARLYGFDALDAVLLLHHLTEFSGTRIIKERLDRLRLVYSDEQIFNIYIKEIQKMTNKNTIENGRKGKFRRKEEISEPLLPIDNTYINNAMDEKYRSAISNFSFHSSYLGYHLLFMEWFFGQHKLPLLISYFNGKSHTGVPLSGVLTSLTLDSFNDEFKQLFLISKAYREKPGRIIDIHD